MKGKHISFILLIIVISLGTTWGLKALNNRYYSIEKSIKYLTDSKFKGRLTGTKENKKVEEHLSILLENIGIDRYKNNTNYAIPYNHIYYPPEKQIYNIDLILKDGKRLSLKRGEDFLENIYSDMEKTLDFTFDTDNNDDKILVASDVNKLKDINSNERIIFLKTSVFKKNINTSEGLDNTNINLIQISPKTYELLEKNKDSKIEINFKSLRENVQANNIVGMIKGKDSSKALVLSAHFDHIGSVGDKVFKGAIDNASGTSLLLDISKKLKEHYSGNPPEHDIVICFFNGEESNLQGSSDFVDTLVKDYSELYNINITSIGIKDDVNTIFSTTDNKENELMVDLKNHFNKNGYKSKIGTSYSSSDHDAFIRKNIIAVNISNENMDKVHTLEDTLDEIDLKYLKNTSNVLFDFIINNKKLTYKVSDSNKNNAVSTPSPEDIKKLNKVFDILKYHQYMLDPSNNKGVIMKSNIVLDSNPNADNNISTLNKYYSNLNVDNSIGNFKLAYVNISEYWPNIDRNSLEPNRVYFRDYNIDDIDNLELLFKNKNEEQLKVNLFIETPLNNMNISQEYPINKYKISNDTKNISGESYYLCLKDNSPKALYKSIKIKDKTFHLLITPFSNNEENINILETLDLKPPIDNLINSF
ncbi:M28 family metallopeptidase [Clostridium sp. Marseille-QA1073]